MIITNEMLAAAFQYRDTEIWRILADNDVFAFRLSDGEIGYCSIMGHGGEHLALGFYRGEKGFATYLKGLTMMRGSEYETFETVVTFDCINCDFMSASDLDNKVKKIIREYADANGLKIRRPKGWPDFTRHQPGRAQYGITREEDARDITEALHAALAVAEKVITEDLESAGFSVKATYPTIKGGKSVPYLIPNGDGTYEWSTTKLPAFVPDKYDVVEFDNDVLAHAMKALPALGTLQMRLIHIPTLLGGSEDEAPFFPTVMLCVEAETGNVFPVTSVEDVEENSMQILVQLARIFSKSNAKPQRIEVEDAKTESFLKDFCQRSGIALSRKHTLPELFDAWTAILDNFMR